jgi:uncharacterized protein YecE (DUF72 family)
MPGNKDIGAVRIGTSGYQYDHWQGPFYPKDMPKSEWFDFFQRHFDTVEINNSFYSLPSIHTFKQWEARASKEFLYSLKFSRYGSHLKHLKDPADTIGKFLEHADHLKGKLGPVLIQLPPQWNAAPDRLDNFLSAAPADHRWAVEFRNPSWLCEQVYEVLRTHHAALCIHDMIDNHPREITADWVYLRFHGQEYAGSYSHQALTAEAQRIKDYCRRGLDVYAYFNNDAEGFAAANASDLKRYVRK